MNAPNTSSGGENQDREREPKGTIEVITEPPEEKPALVGIGGEMYEE